LFSLNPVGFARAYEEGDYLEDAEKELVRFLVDTTTPPRSAKDEESQRTRLELQQAYYQLGAVVRKQGRSQEAAKVFRRALDRFPQNANLRLALGTVLWQDGEQVEAEKCFQSVEHENPNDATVLRRLGHVYLTSGRPAMAIECFRKAGALAANESALNVDLAIAMQMEGKMTEAIDLYLRVLSEQPESHDALNNLAWIYATHPDSRYRNGKQALALAKQLCDLTKHENPAYLDALAAAHAELGDFQQAARIADKAVHLAVSTGQENLASQLLTRSLLYKAAKPYRESTPTGP
jgi:tetratricopeptide (TPR) repeat protein